MTMTQAQKTVAIIIAAMVACALCVLFSGCASVAHSAGLATTEDLEDVRLGQHKVDSKIIRAVADAIEKRCSTEEMVARAKAAMDNSDLEWVNRPEPPDRWTEVILGVIGLLTTGVTTYHVTNRSRDNQRMALGERTLRKPVVKPRDSREIATGGG